MLLLAHVIIALSSLVLTGLAYIRPTQEKLRVSYALVGLTLASGTVLVITTHSPLLSSCVTGLVYLGIVLSGIIATRHKLATDNTL